MYKAFKQFVPEMATPEMTAKLEAEMDQIAAGDMTREDVVGDSRKMLHETYDEIDGSREDFAKQIWAGMDEDKFLGPCKVCEEAGRKREDGSPNRLRIIELKGGKRMYGCEGWIRDDPESPDSCQVSGPLPGRNYDLWRLEERCTVCGETPRLTVKGFRGRPWKLCLNDDCPTMVEMREKKAEREAAKAAKAAAKGNGAKAESNGKEETPAKAKASANGGDAEAEGDGNGSADPAKIAGAASATRTRSTRAKRAANAKRAAKK
jgi:DNA topoisomerase-1